MNFIYGLFFSNGFLTDFSRAILDQNLVYFLSIRMNLFICLKNSDIFPSLYSLFGPNDNFVNLILILIFSVWTFVYLSQDCIFWTIILLTLFQIGYKWTKYWERYNNNLQILEYWFVIEILWIFFLLSNLKDLLFECIGYHWNLDEVQSYEENFTDKLKFINIYKEKLTAERSLAA